MSRLFASALYGDLFPTGAVGRLWTDSAEVRAMLLVEGALAKVQGGLGVIPEVSGAFIHRAAMEIQIDPAGLRAATGRNGVPVPALVQAFRAAMEAPEHAQYLHWGATSQDIMDTGLMLRLRQSLGILEARLRDLLKAMGDQAGAHAETVMLARTYGQAAAPTTWGAVLAQWGTPLADALDRLEALRAQALWVSLGGAAGTGAALPHLVQTRAALAESLNLHDPGRTWHTDRGPILRIAAWLGEIVTALAAMGKSLIARAGTDVTLASGASSTMPQKQNPVGPSVLVALGATMAAHLGALHTAASHQDQRDGGVWFAEWLTLPQTVLAAAAAIETANTILPTLTPLVDHMRERLEASPAFAEALSFALARQMPREAARDTCKAWIAEAAASGRSLKDVAGPEHAQVFDPVAQSGDAVASARAFAARVT